MKRRFKLFFVRRSHSNGKTIAKRVQWIENPSFTVSESMNEIIDYFDRFFLSGTKRLIDKELGDRHSFALWEDEDGSEISLDVVFK